MILFSALYVRVLYRLQESLKESRLWKETILVCHLKSIVTFIWSLPRLNPKWRCPNRSQKSCLKKVKSPTASTKRAFGEFWTGVHSMSYLQDYEEYLRVQPEPPVNNTVVFLKIR